MINFYYNFPEMLRYYRRDLGYSSIDKHERMLSLCLRYHQEIRMACARNFQQERDTNLIERRLQELTQSLQTRLDNFEDRFKPRRNALSPELIESLENVTLYIAGLRGLLDSNKIVPIVKTSFDSQINKKVSSTEIHNNIATTEIKLDRHPAAKENIRILQTFKQETILLKNALRALQHEITGPAISSTKREFEEDEKVIKDIQAHMEQFPIELIELVELMHLRDESWREGINTLIGYNITKRERLMQLAGISKHDRQYPFKRNYLRDIEDLWVARRRLSLQRVKYFEFSFFTWRNLLPRTMTNVGGFLLFQLIRFYKFLILTRFRLFNGSWRPLRTFIILLVLGGMIIWSLKS